MVTVHTSIGQLPATDGITLNQRLLRRLLPIIFIFCLSYFGVAQEPCALGIGGKDHELIIEVFRLDGNQIKKMRNWGAELKFRNEIFELRAERLLKNHPQGSVEDILLMSKKYKVLLDSIEKNSRMIDKRMLGIFNDEQYNLYVKLCNQAYRVPVYAERPVDEK